MRCIDEVRNLVGTTVLVRSGLNAPVKDGVVMNDFRIRKALPTLRFLSEHGAKVIVIAHIGREPDETLTPIVAALREHIPCQLTTREELDVEAIREGEIVVLENLRQDPREKSNDDSLAQELAAYADIFVQDAFSVAHREHASIIGIPKYIESYAGLLFKAEMHMLSTARDPEHPALFVLGGAKFETKEPLIRKFLDVYDDVFVGGALQNEILAARGVSVGASVVEDGRVPEDILQHEKLMVVTDVVVEREGKPFTVETTEVKEGDVIVDIGEDTMETLFEKLSRYKTIVWNGPLGWYERGYTDATVMLLQRAADSGARVIVGGGDTVALVQQAGLEDAFAFVSTGGGAMITYLQDGTLPGIEALKNN